jgi:hypothetical protein
MPRCGDHLRVLAFLTDPDVTTTILEHLDKIDLACD